MINFAPRFITKENIFIGKPKIEGYCGDYIKAIINKETEEVLILTYSHIADNFDLLKKELEKSGIIVISEEDYTNQNNWRSWHIPVKYELTDIVSVKAPSLEMAIKIAKDEHSLIPLMLSGDMSYTEETWELLEEDVDVVREVYNDNIEDDENAEEVLCYA